MSRPFIHLMILAICCMTTFMAVAQPVTGVWKGRMGRRKVEVKIIQKGDSLTGTSYYFESAKNYRRYSIKGYFDTHDNSVVWWDDQLIEDKGNSNKALLAVADFNCPGGGEMHLNGSSSQKDNRDVPAGPVALTKVPDDDFPDEWNFVIDNYTVGANDPNLIDSIGRIAINKTPEPPLPRKVQEKKVSVAARPGPAPSIQIPTSNTPSEDKSTVIIAPVNIEKKFTSRNKVFTKEIPVIGDSIELRFYDNAEIDGDSISLFLNSRLIFEHIRLSDKAYSIKLAAKDLSDTNELVMVAENLGSIPPNTSYMVALCGDQRYDAQLASTENSSAMIRLRKRSAGQ